MFFFPSSIAVHGFRQSSDKSSAVIELNQHLEPTTIYGVTKLHGEQLGRYFSRHYQQGSASAVDFRCLRYPGLLSAETLPSGGTSDYAPEMLHAAAQGQPYPCFVRPDTRMPFMTMPDAIDATLRLVSADRAQLSQSSYALSAFSPSAAELRDLVLCAYPDAAISFAIDAARQQIVDSWPADVDASAARRDWGFAPRHDLQRAFTEYLLPAVQLRYRTSQLAPRA
jgi:nucleoside-diphosphate-sugar epimerase